MNSLIRSKKGQIEGLSATVLALTIAGIFMVLGLVMMGSIRDTDTVASSQTGVTINGTTPSVNEIGDQLSGSAQPGAHGFVITLAINTTSGTIIPSSNYTVSATNGTIRYTAGTNLQGFNNSNWNVSYTFVYGAEAYQATNKTIIGVAKFADFWQIIVLAIVISLVIGILLRAFGTSRVR